MAVTHGGNIFSVAVREQLPWQQVLDFSASINPLGPSAAAREAIYSAVDRIAHYPERTCAGLRERLAAEWGVRPEQVMAGNGATDLLFDWCRYFGTGTIAAPAFGEFHRAWPEARLCLLSERETWPADGPMVLTRPANPTGTLVSVEAVLEYARERTGPILVDESFVDFCEAESLTPLAGGNLFVLRSLTKFWALPGLRIGALVGDIDALARLRPPWPVNALAEAAALASIEDREHAARTLAFVRTESAWLADELRQLPGLHVWEPMANYLFVETARAAELTEYAAARRVLLRDCSRWPGFAIPAVRAAVRKRWENDILIRVCKECLCD
jgi:threonine-phosphate decarboxylase